MIDKTLLKRTFGRLAQYYDTYSSVQNLAASRLIKKIKPQGINNILEIGCGTGNYTQALCEKFPKARLTAVDISQEMICVAKKKLGTTAAEFRVADGEEIDFCEHFDLITSNATVQWFQDLKKALINYKRLLGLGGQIYFSTFGPLTFYELRESLRELDGKKYIAAENFIDKDKIKEILSSQFAEVEVKEERLATTHTSLKELLEHIKYTSGINNGVKNIWTPRVLSTLEKIYIKKFKRISATYQVFLCNAE